MLLSCGADGHHSGEQHRRRDDADASEAKLLLCIGSLAALGRSSAGSYGCGLLLSRLRCRFQGRMVGLVRWWRRLGSTTKLCSVVLHFKPRLLAALEDSLSLDGPSPLLFGVFSDNLTVALLPEH